MEQKTPLWHLFKAIFGQTVKMNMQVFFKANYLSRKYHLKYHPYSFLKSAWKIYDLNQIFFRIVACSETGIVTYAPLNVNIEGGGGVGQGVGI